MSKINQLLNKGPKDAGKTASKDLLSLSEEKEVSQPADQEEKEFEPSVLLPEETKEGSKRFILKRPNGRKVHYVGGYRELKVPSTFVTPNIYASERWCKPVFTARQWKWKENVVTNNYLRKKTPDVIKSNNRLGLRRYLFVNEFLACKEGMFYYLLPLLTSLLFLFTNINKDNFVVNACVAWIVCFDMLLIYTLMKSKFVEIKKFLIFGLILAVNITIFILAQFINGFYELLNLWFIFKLVVLVLSCFYFARFYVYFAMSYSADLKPDFGNVVKVISGPPGCGKTSKSVNESKVLALLKWQKLQLEFWLWHSREKQILKRNNQDELLEYHAIKESYAFYIIRPCIPCLWSNIAIEDDKERRSFKITMDHIRGVERLPNHSVVLFDEIGAVLSNEMSKEKSANFDIADMFRLGRHFLNWIVICCEQDYNNVFISIRRVVGVNELLSSQEWVAKPVIAYGVLKFLEWWIADGLDWAVGRNPVIATIFQKFSKFVYSIGFRKYSYQSVGNTQTNNDTVVSDADQKVRVITKNRVRYVPSKLLAKYDDRAYKQLYPSYFDKTIKGSVHESLTIDGANVKYGGQFISGTPLTAEKREAVTSELEKVA